MSPKQLQDAICLGKSRKEPGIIGQYGLGLKRLVNFFSFFDNY